MSYDSLTESNKKYFISLEDRLLFVNEKLKNIENDTFLETRNFKNIMHVLASLKSNNPEFSEKEDIFIFYKMLSFKKESGFKNRIRAISVSFDDFLEKNNLQYPFYHNFEKVMQELSSSGYDYNFPLFIALTHNSDAIILKMNNPDAIIEKI